MRDRDKPVPFHQRSIGERLQALGLGAPAGTLTSLGADAADRMIENVIGVFGLPYAAALRLRVDGQVHNVPVAVEEASIVAALCAAAKMFDRAGGVRTHCSESLLAGQVHLTEVDDCEAACRRLNADKATWLARANALMPRLCRRGGGARDFDAQILRAEGAPPSVRVHVYVDTQDAMGANIVNSLCEALAPALLAAAGARRALSILSNFTERSLVQAEVSLPPADLGWRTFSGEQVRDGIVGASRFAECDAHRAVTHNKGIMNGIDAVAVATGNDWRAIEANAHAWAGRGEGYRPLSTWRTGSQGELCGLLKMPLKVGTRGGNFTVNPSVAHSFALLGVEHADTLARVMAATGLAQNFAALRALGTEGIQRGHMSLHARSVVASAGVPREAAAAVTQAMLERGDISVSAAQAIAEEQLPGESSRPCAAAASTTPDGVGDAAGKVLLFGEHAVVYGKHALALPLNVRCRATVHKTCEGGARLAVPAWQIEARLNDEPEVGGVHHSLQILLAKLGLLRSSFLLHIEPGVPRGVGLGSSAALAVAVVRALSSAFALHLDDAAISATAFEAEKVAHATPSGVDNALSAYERPLLFRRGEPAVLQRVAVGAPLHMVIGLSHEHSSTATMVRAVATAREAHPLLVDDLFARIDALALMGRDALERGDLAQLGKLMNVNHGLLHALDLSTAGVEDIVLRARAAGALGAKMTGGGGGGAVVALCTSERTAAVRQAIAAGGYREFGFVVAQSSAGGARGEVDHVQAG